MFFRESWALRPCKISRRVSNESGVMWAGTCLYFSSQKRKPPYQKICFSKKHRSDWILFFYPPLAVNHPACWIQRGTPAHFARSEVEKKKNYAASKTFQITMEQPHALWWTFNQAAEILSKHFPCYCAIYHSLFIPSFEKELSEDKAVQLQLTNSNKVKTNWHVLKFSKWSVVI